jgi:hypothetical protein
MKKSYVIEKFYEEFEDWPEGVSLVVKQYFVGKIPIRPGDYIVTDQDGNRTVIGCKTFDSVLNNGHSII